MNIRSLGKKNNIGSLWLNLYRIYEVEIWPSIACDESEKLQFVSLYDLWVSEYREQFSWVAY